MHVIRDNIQYVCVSFVSVQRVSAVNFSFFPCCVVSLWKKSQCYYNNVYESEKKFLFLLGRGGGGI